MLKRHHRQRGLRMNQRYFEIEREAQERAQEIATNVKTQFEHMQRM